MKQAISNAGIKQNRDGTAEIPASKRSDGSTRAPIRVRPGYIPPEDKPKYKPPRTRQETTMNEPVAVDKSKPTTDSTAQKVEEDKPEPAVTAAKDVLSAWSSAGWRGEETSSRYASTSATTAEVSTARRIAHKKPPVSNSTKTTTKMTTKTTTTEASKKDTSRKVEEAADVADLEEELQKVKLTSS